MPTVRVIGPTATNAAAGVQIEIASARSPWTMALLLAWLTGWMLATVATALSVGRFGPGAAPFATIGVALLLIGGPAVLAVLVWAASGFPETLVIRNGELTLRRGWAQFARTHAFPPFTIQDLQPTPANWRILEGLAAIRHFWVGGSGRIQFAANGLTYAAGVMLSDDQALGILNELRNRVPLAPPALGEPWHNETALRIQRWIAGFVTMVMLGPLAMLPVRALVVDRVSCFGVGHAEPRLPVDVRGLAPKGVVYLVPLDDFPVATAESIARFFDQRFGTRIAVQPPLALPPSFFDNYAGQLNARAAVDLLDKKYSASDERVVAIALTRSDMYIPDFGWSYAFSYRGRDRLAIVSSARMDHGCMGVVPADQALQQQRLRKMVGKNVGVLYYLLPLSRDRRSLLYGSVGGPQELDVMAETF
jgi:hypothetical protein